MLKPLKLAFLMDPAEKIKSLEDTTFLLMEEAFRRGHRIFHLVPEDLSLHSQKGLRLSLHEVTVDEVHGIRTKHALQDIPLDFLDCLWIRKDPPVDLSYFHFLLLLARHSSDTCILNDPSALLLGNEKLLPFHFPQFMPKTLVSFKDRSLDPFLKAQKRAVWKPLPERSGRGIEMIKNGKKSSIKSVWGLTQQFLPAIRTQGDKRIFLLEGRFLAAYSRIPSPGNWLLTPDTADGSLKAARLTRREHKVISTIGPWLARNGFFFVGVDLIGEKLTEINVTSPGGLAEANHFQKRPDLQKKVIDCLERKIRNS